MGTESSSYHFTSLYTPMFNMQSSASLCLQFNFYVKPSNDGHLYIELRDEKRTTKKQLLRISVSKLPAQKWKEITIPLPAQKGPFKCDLRRSTEFASFKQAVCVENASFNAAVKLGVGGGCVRWARPLRPASDFVTLILAVRFLCGGDLGRLPIIIITNSKSISIDMLISLIVIFLLLQCSNVRATHSFDTNSLPGDGETEVDLLVPVESALNSDPRVFRAKGIDSLPAIGIQVSILIIHWYMRRMLDSFFKIFAFNGF
ncbi:hypothetical protein GCK32_017622 [Trichostrongylus colubriformis]|uniref:MAM domain-containing protein n=1 Tax=Trichostrongylus colubriformis TaxID=6319 RepID=A0AAN8G4S0_TRICO